MKMKITIIFIVMILVSIGFIIYDYVSSNSLNFNKQNSKQEIGRSVDIHNDKYSIEYPVIGNKIIDKKISKRVNQYVNEFMHSKKKYSYVNYESYLGIDNNISIVFIKNIEKNNKLLKEEIEIHNYNLSTGEELKDSYIFVGNYNNLIDKYVKEYISNSEKYKDKCDLNKLNENYKYKYALTNKGLNIYFNRNELCDKSYGVININIPYKKLNEVINIDYSKKVTKKNASNNKPELSKYVSIDKYMYVKSVSNFYLDDSKNSKLVNTIGLGSKVYVINGNDNWYKIKYHKKEGYIEKNHLRKKIIIYDGFSKTNDKVYALSNIDLKKSYDVNSESLYSIEKGTEIARVGTSENGWSQLLYKDDVVFVYSSYLTPNKEDLDKKEPEVVRVEDNIPMVALTFDDGPNPITSNRILDILESNGAKATFFELGSLMNNYPDIIKREEAIGCEVGSHTFSHVNLNKLSANEIQSEVASSDEAFINILGHKPSLVRPPYGNANDVVKANIPYPLINWDVDTLDWKSRNRDAVLAQIRAVDNYDGRIILMHSIYSSTADAVEIIVPELISKGYQLVTVSQLAQAKGVTLTAGNVYLNFVN